ncbi:MAG: sigma-70 family RNA polymerase sigma factor [Actinomycetota bacterium]
MEAKADAGLAERLLARDEDSLREVIDAYGGRVYAVARRVVADPTLAEEVAQDTFLALWRRPGAFDPDRGTLQTFLLGVARNKAVDLVRREQASRRKAEALLAQVENESTRASGDEQLEGIDTRQDLRRALDGLSLVQRQAIVLAYFGGRTYREVAEELDVPEGTAKTRLRDGLIRLRKLMSTHRSSE